MESYGYSTEDVVFKWVDENPIQINEETELPKYDVLDTKTGDCTKVYSTGKNETNDRVITIVITNYTR